jgi:hypothetical protein
VSRSKLAVVAVLVVASVSLAFANPGGEKCREAAAAAAAQGARKFDYQQELFFAVLEGLYVDGVSSDAVDAIVARDQESGYPANLVWGCPICMPAFDAMTVYRARPRLESHKEITDTFGPGLDPAKMSALTSGAPEQRRAAIMELVQGWAARRMDALRLTDAERDAWRTEMEMLRKKGMEMLTRYRDMAKPGSYASMKACPFCDAANGACGRR